MARVDFYHDSSAPKPEVIVPAVSAVIITKNKNILLQERVDNGKWSLPGGQMEPGESVTQAIVREVKEETGIDIEVVKLVGVYSDPNHVIAYDDGEVRQQFSICFLCEVVSGKLSVSSESKRVTYVPIEEVDSIEMHVTQKIRIQDALKGEREAFIR